MSEREIVKTRESHIGCGNEVAELRETNQVYISEAKMIWKCGFYNINY